MRQQRFLFLEQQLLFGRFSQPIEMRGNQNEEKQEDECGTCGVGDSVDVVSDLCFKMFDDIFVAYLFGFAGLRSGEAALAVEFLCSGEAVLAAGEIWDVGGFDVCKF